MKLSANEFSQVCAALQEAEREQATSDRRRHCRITLPVFGVSVFDLDSSRRYTAIVRDVSINGVSLLQSWPPSTGSQIIVTFMGKKKGQSEVRCEVVYVNEQANKLYAVGCTFVQIETATAPPA
jgi:PilZ domain